MLTALASFVDARANQGFWHLRIDDLDTPRNQPGAVGAILAILEAAHLFWDGPVLHQSQQIQRYEHAIEDLVKRGLAYRCTCSRKELGEVTDNPAGNAVYPGLCRYKNPAPEIPHAIRIRVRDTKIGFTDRIQGHYEQVLAREVGDFVIKRRDRIVAYQLAVVIDDAAQGITRVVRGYDLMDSTPRQIYLHQNLAMPIPEYAHVPLIVDPNGFKLSKQTGAEAVREKGLSSLLFELLALLNHKPPRNLNHAPPPDLLSWAIANWNIERIPKHLEREAMETVWKPSTKLCGQGMSLIPRPE